jgi:hypothetical protein
MVKALVTEIDIDAPRQRVWQILVELPAYQEWNPFIVEVAAGRAQVGDRLTLRMKNVGGRVTTTRPTVVEAHEGELLRWQGRLRFPGIFDVVHSFALEDRAGNGTRLVQKEDFRGVLVPLVARTLDRGTLPAFVLMNQALKRRAEESVDRSHG